MITTAAMVAAACALHPHMVMDDQYRVSMVMQVNQYGCDLARGKYAYRASGDKELQRMKAEHAAENAMMRKAIKGAAK
jgi:hypothetical protein